jgi:hypothetical protein
MGSLVAKVVPAAAAMEDHPFAAVQRRRMSDPVKVLVTKTAA